MQLIILKAVDSGVLVIAYVMQQPTHSETIQRN